MQHWNGSLVEYVELQTDVLHAIPIMQYWDSIDKCPFQGW
jgi:hypothetical protein